MTALLRQGARRLVQQAVEMEFEELLARHAPQTDAQGRASVVRNGYLPERDVVTGLGPLAVRVPKVRSRTEEPVVFHSRLVPPYVRRARTLDAALPGLSLKGISTGQMQEGLEVLVGPEARGLSASVVSRLKRQWQEEYATWRRRRLDGEHWVYWWVDGVYSGLRAERQRVCILVLIGLDAHGEKHLVALEDGVRESTQSWREVLVDLKARGLTAAPAVAVGDGALGFWAALAEVFPTTRPQRCWVHKTANVLNYLPRTVQAKAKEALQEIWMAPTRAEADRAALLTFYDFPAEHWVHLRTTNPVESTLGTIRQRTDRAKGCVTRATMLAFAFKRALCAERRWHRIRGLSQLDQVVQGMTFQDGTAVESAGQAA